MKFLTGVLWLFFQNAVSQSSFDSLIIPANAIGYIFSGDSAIGTGFVIGKTNWVVTCDHVGKKRSSLKSYVTYKSKKTFALKLVYSFPKYDLALYESEVPITENIFEFDSKYDFKPHCKIGYIGFHKGESSELEMKGDFAEVFGIGTTWIGELNTKYIEFNGIGEPGFSGSPIFNSEGKVVAILANAMYFESLKNSDNRILINRAFSISPIADLLR